MRPRWRLTFKGPVAPEVIRWLQKLIPVLREAPTELEITVEIDNHKGEPDETGP